MEDTRAYIVTGSPRGVTLRQMLDMENVDLTRAFALSQQMARGLAALHAQGIVDIDLRPQLVTVDRVDEADRAQIDDVGLRRLLHRLGYASQQLDDIGFLDPRYTSPEHLQNGQIGAWSDVYQLGLLLFELVAGRLPFVGRNPAETASLQCSTPVPRLDQFAHEAPPMLQNLVERALAKNPAQRYPSIEAMLADLVTISTLATAHQQGASSALNAPMSRAQTAEMDTVPPQEDMTLRSTLLEGEKTQRKPSSQAVEVPDGTLAYLTFEQEGGEPQRFFITSKYVVVGRKDPKRGLHPDLDLTGIDPRMTISRQHARIRYENQLFYIEDLKSHNKTRLGELTLTPLQAELLQHGDIIHFGSVRVQFRVPGKKDTPPLKE